MKFEDLIGKTVPVKIPMISDQEFQEIIIRGVEHGGIWFESEAMTQGLLTGLNVPGAKTPIFFVPYNAIKFAYYPIDKLALSNKAFGV